MQNDLKSAETSPSESEIVSLNSNTVIATTAPRLEERQIDESATTLEKSSESDTLTVSSNRIKNYAIDNSGYPAKVVHATELLNETTDEEEEPLLVESDSNLETANSIKSEPPCPCCDHPVNRYAIYQVVFK